MNFLRGILDWFSNKDSTLQLPEATHDTNREISNNIALPDNLSIAAEEKVETTPPTQSQAKPAISEKKTTLRSDKGKGRGKGSLPRITVGFDFGTHSSKVVYRKHGDKASYLLSLDSPCDGYPSFASPSLVCLDNGRLWFGSAANRATGYVYRYLKVRLLGPNREVSLDDYPSGPTPHELVVAYLAWSFQQIHKQLQTTYGEHRLRFNLAAPMLHFQDDRLREVYLHLVQAAWQIAIASEFELDQGMELKTLQPIIKSKLEEPLISESERHFEVLPETIAPIVSMDRNPRYSHGFYLMVDMGGGTTEVSINNIGEGNSEYRVLCYADDLIQFGGIDFDACSKPKLAKTQSELLEKLRKCTKKVWHDGFRKDMDGLRSVRDRWKKLTVLLTGGGTKRENLVRMIESNPLQKAVFNLDPVKFSVERYKPNDIVLGNAKSSDVDLSLLSVAHGLSYDAPRWPELYMPKEIEPLEKSERVEVPDPFHYVGGK